MSLSNRRKEVLSLYKRLLRLSQNWIPKDAINLCSDRLYIKNEATSIFRQNRNLTDDTAINDCIREGETRIDIALHYRNPYPRPVNVPPRAMAQKHRKYQGVNQETLNKD